MTTEMMMVTIKRIGTKKKIGVTTITITTEEDPEEDTKQSPTGRSGKGSAEITVGHDANHRVGQSDFQNAYAYQHASLAESNWNREIPCATRSTTGMVFNI